MKLKCPGSQSFSQPHPEDINCPFCGSEVEMRKKNIKTRGDALWEINGRVGRISFAA